MKHLAGVWLHRIAILGLGLICASTLFGISPNHANADPRQNPYPFGTSTYWAWQNRPDLPANLGIAKDWNDRVVALGWPIGAYPRHGSVAVFEPNVLGADSTTGRVAVVKQVFDNGTYSTTEMDDEDCRGAGQSCGHVNTPQYALASGVSFIYYMKDTRTTWGFAAGAAGWTAANLGAGSMAGSGWYYPLTGGRPSLTSPELDIPLEGYNAIEVQMALEPGMSGPRIRLSFATSGKPQFSDTRGAWLSGKADGLSHTYIFCLGSHPDWQGNLIQLRLNPSGVGSAGGVHMTRVRLIQLDLNIPAGISARVPAAE